MSSKVNIKVAFDTASGALLTIGLAGLGFGVYQENLIAGLFGAVSVVLALAVSYARNTWNEKEKSKDMNTVVNATVEDSAKKVVNTVIEESVRKSQPIIEDCIKKVVEESAKKVQPIIVRKVKEVEIPKPLFH